MMVYGLQISIRRPRLFKAKSGESNFKTSINSVKKNGLSNGLVFEEVIQQTKVQNLSFKYSFFSLIQRLVEGPTKAVSLAR